MSTTLLHTSGSIRRADDSSLLVKTEAPETKTDPLRLFISLFYEISRHFCFGQYWARKSGHISQLEKKSKIFINSWPMDITIFDGCKSKLLQFLERISVCFSVAKSFIDCFIAPWVVMQIESPFTKDVKTRIRHIHVFPAKVQGEGGGNFCHVFFPLGKNNLTGFKVPALNCSRISGEFSSLNSWRRTKTRGENPFFTTLATFFGCILLWIYILTSNSVHPNWVLKTFLFSVSDHRPCSDHHGVRYPRSVQQLPWFSWRLLLQHPCKCLEQHSHVHQCHWHCLIQVLLVVVGCIIFFITFFGCCGAIKEHHCMTLTFAVILSLILIIEIGAGISSYAFRDQVKIVQECSRICNYDIHFRFRLDQSLKRTWRRAWRTTENRATRESPKLGISFNMRWGLGKKLEHLALC